MKTIPLTKGFVAIVDDEMLDFLCQWKWSTTITKDGNIYARRWTRKDGRRITIAMHTTVLGVTNGTQIDHRDGNGLNNQRDNLRIANCSQNQANCKMKKSNKSGFKGVCRVSFNQGRYYYWSARITVNRRFKHIGLFKNKIDAARAYDEKAEKAWGEFALTNKKLGLL